MLGFVGERLVNIFLQRAQMIRQFAGFCLNFALGLANLFQNILHRLNQFRSLFYQPVGPLAFGTVNVSGYGKNFPVLIQGKQSADQCTAPVTGFDNQGTQRQAADNPIPLWEICRIRAGPDKVFGDDSAMPRDILKQFSVLRRITAIHAASQHCHGLPPGLDGGVMCNGIHAPGKPADDADIPVYQTADYLLGDHLAVV